MTRDSERKDSTRGMYILKKNLNGLVKNVFKEGLKREDSHQNQYV